MEMISAKTAYLDSLAGYTDELEKIKEQILEVIQLANTEGKFQATYSIEQCPQEIINWLGEYGYTVVIEDGYIQIDWGNALVDEADLQVQVDEQDIDPTDIDNTTVEEQVVDGGSSAQEEETLKEGLKEIYISEQNLQGYRVNNIVIYSGNPIEQAGEDGAMTVTYNSYFHLSLVNNETGENRFARLWIARDAASPTGIGGSMTAMIEGSCDKKGQPLVFSNVPMEKEEVAGNVDEDTSGTSAQSYVTRDTLNAESAEDIARLAENLGYAFATTTRDALVTDYLNGQQAALSAAQAQDPSAELPGSRTAEELYSLTTLAILVEMTEKIYAVSNNTKSAMIDDVLAAQRLARFYYENDLGAISLADILALANDKGYSINAGVKEQLIKDIMADAPQGTYTEVDLNNKTVTQLIELATTQDYDIGESKQEAIDLFLAAQGTNDEGQSGEDVIPLIERVYVYYEVNSDGRPYRGTIPFEANNVFASTISVVPSSIIKPHIYEALREQSMA